MSELDLILFLTASLALIVLPGPDNTLVLTRGVAQGVGRRWSPRRPGSPLCWRRPLTLSRSSSMLRRRA